MSPSSKKTLRLVQFNVENLFIFLDQYKGQNLAKINENEWQSFSTSTTTNKPLRKIRALADIIQKLNPDILMLNEVGGFESLDNFNKHFLSDQFIPLLKEGNSRRGIDVGYLMRKNLDYKPLLISHKDRPIHFLYPHENQTPSGGKSHYFSRDVAELRLFKPGSTTPQFIILLTHLKSKLDSERIDTEGRKRRAAELNCLVDIYNEIKQEELSPDTGIIVSGDFNGIASKINTEEEFAPLHNKTDLIEVLDHVELDEKKRFTQVQITHSGQQHFLQIDYVFVSPNLADSIIKEESYVYHFSDIGAGTYIAPKNLEERSLLASDHYPVVVTLKV